MGRKGWGGAPPRHTSLSEIANDLGITRPTIYRYFASTEDLPR
jgi:AcrR family transcriptional regulator